MNQDILEKFLSNKCSYKECDSIAERLTSDLQALDDIDLFENITEQEIIPTLDFEKEAFLKLVLKRQIFPTYLKKILVAALILIVGTLSFYKIGMEEFSMNNASPITFTLANNSSSSKWYMLPDSSRVKLQPNAKLSYPADFLLDRKIAQEQGEITYYVLADSARPFRVVYQGVQTKALGTIFTIADYNQENLLINLLEGKVVITDQQINRDKQIMLTGREAIMLNKEDFTYTKLSDKATNASKTWASERKMARVNFPKSSISWSNEVVLFNGVPNADLFSIIERLFGVTIDVRQAQMMNGNFTGEVLQTDNLENFLTNFCQINGCEFSIHEQIILIK